MTRAARPLPGTYPGILVATGGRRGPGWGLVVVAVLTAGCGAEDGAPLRTDPRLLARAHEVIEAGATVPLTDIAGPLSWDRALTFPGPHTRAGIEARVGAELDVPDTYPDSSGGILVLITGGRVTTTVGLSPWPFSPVARDLSPRATAGPPAPGAGWLQLVDSPDAPASRCAPRERNPGP